MKKSKAISEKKSLNNRYCVEQFVPKIIYMYNIYNKKGKMLLFTTIGPKCSTQYQTHKNSNKT